MIVTSVCMEIGHLQTWAEIWAGPSVVARIGLAVAATIIAINSDKTNTVRVEPPKS